MGPGQPEPEAETEGHSENQIRLIIGEKLLQYKKNLQGRPTILFSAKESDEHRASVAQVYPEIKEVKTRLLDCKLYSYFLQMQRFRDKRFFPDQTTNQERIERFGSIMMRLSTPILFLNHNHDVRIRRSENKATVVKVSSKTEQTGASLSTLDLVSPTMSIQDLQKAKDHLKKVLLAREAWTKGDLGRLLNGTTADLLSQMLSTDLDFFLIRPFGTEEVKFISDLDNYHRKGVTAYLLEPGR